MPQDSKCKISLCGRTKVKRGRLSAKSQLTWYHMERSLLHLFAMLSGMESKIIRKEQHFCIVCKKRDKPASSPSPCSFLLSHNPTKSAAIDSLGPYLALGRAERATQTPLSKDCSTKKHKPNSFGRLDRC